VARCRDKHQTRKALLEHNAWPVRSVAVSSVEDALAVCHDFGYPTVLKPRSLAGSFGVVKVNSDDELRNAFHIARNAAIDGVKQFESEGVLIEEFLEGPEISVDCAWIEGRIFPIFLARKLKSYPPYFEEVGHIVRATDDLIQDEQLLNFLSETHRAVGFTDGITHTELMLTPKGPRLVEINCRYGGDLIPYVGYLATGIDPGKILVEVACGQCPSFDRSLTRSATVRFIYPPKDVVVGNVEIEREKLPHEVDTARVLAPEGRKLFLPPVGHVTCRYAAIVIVNEPGQDFGTTLAAIESACTLTTVEGESFKPRLGKDFFE
jgi:biotin carboxylase